MPRTRQEVISEMVDSGLFTDDEIRSAVKMNTAKTETVKEQKPGMMQQAADVAGDVLKNPLMAINPAVAMASTIGGRAAVAHPEALPTVGSIAMPAIAAAGSGGLSLPASAGLAGIGGAAGKAAEQMVRRYKGEKTPDTMGGAAADIGIEGVKQGAYDLAGGLATKAAVKTGSEGMRRALGFTKRFLNNKQKVKAVEGAVKEMGDAGVVGAFSSPEKILERVNTVKDTAGKEIGAFLKKNGMGFNATEAIQELEKLRPKASGGLNNVAHDQINRAIETIKGYGEEIIPFETANEIKGILQNAADFEDDKFAGETLRKTAGAFREYLDNSLESASQLVGKDKDFAQFLKNKKLYQAASKAEEGLYNRISSEGGNKLFGLTDWISAGVGSAVGSAAGGIAGAPIGMTLLPIMKKLSEKYGAQTAAVIGKAVERNPQMLPMVMKLIGGGVEGAINETPR